VGYEEAVAYLDDLGIDAMKRLKPNTARIEALCDILNHPEGEVPAIHVTGTNGKTSTARIASSLLTAADLSVATYTSPHLVSVRERLTLAGEPISEHAFGELFDHVMPYVRHVEGRLGERITYFELLTAMFFLWAAETPVDAIVVEVGLGGRWDATNVLPASTAVITQVALDHTANLGSDRPTIAREKAGIIKPDGDVITAERSPEILAVIADEAARAEGRVLVLDRDFELLENQVAFGGRYMSIRTSATTYEGLFLPLHGAHQGVNAATALEAVTRYIPARILDQAVVAAGMSAVEVPGRLETIRSDEVAVPIILDVAHNPDGMSALVTSLLEAFAFDRVVFVVGILGDKDHHGMIAEMARVPCRLIVTQPRSGRSISIDDLRSSAEQFDLDCEVVDDVSDAVKHALAGVAEGDLVCVTGSHYVVGEARPVLLP
jgi:dihydrofolate synthase/folylpolyglutamate synthase